MMTTLALALSVLSTLTLSVLILAEGASHFETAPSWRKLALSIAIVNGLMVVLVTEFLSALGRLEFGWTLTAWVLLGTLQIPFWRRLIRTLRSSRATSVPLTKIDIALIVPVVAIVLCTGVIGLASAPNSWDALFYHLSRVAHWKQNGSVEFFPTWGEHQLYFPPFAEYAILNLQLLTGGDRFAALVQWLSFVGALLGVSMIAAEFGASRRGQLLAVIFAATVPMTILQASSTQNDLVVGFWLVCFCYFSIGFVRRHSRFDGAAASGALGLALLTKATAYLLVPGFAIGFLILAVRRQGLRVLPLAFAGLLLAGGVSVAFYARNASMYGEPVGSARVRAAHVSTSARRAPLISGLLRGAALHASSPPQRFRLPERAKAAVESIERYMYGSVTSMPLDAKDWRYTMSLEDRAGAPFHFLTILGVLGVLGLKARTWRIPAVVLWHLVGLVAGVMLLSGYILWNPYMVRFHMDLFLLAAPVAGLVATHMKRPQIAVAVAALLLWASGYPLTRNYLRPLFGPLSIFHTPRREQYFMTWSPERRDAMLAAIDYLAARRDTVVGLRPGGTSNEYPYWILLPEVAAGRARLCHVDVPNRSRVLQSAEGCRPSAIVTDDVKVDTLSVNAVRYSLTWRKGEFGIYLPAQ